MFAGRHSFRRAVGFAALAGMLLAPSAQADKDIQWRYGHMNTPSSAAGFQAAWFAEAVEKNTNGQIKIKVYPAQARQNAGGSRLRFLRGRALSHRLQQPGIGSLYEPFAAPGTPTCTAISITS